MPSYSQISNLKVLLLQYPGDFDPEDYFKQNTNWREIPLPIKKVHPAVAPRRKTTIQKFIQGKPPSLLYFHTHFHFIK